MSLATALGYLAAVASAASFAPQAWKIIRSRQTKDISVGMYLLTVAAFTLWLIFGVLERQWPLVVSNGICLLLSSFIFAMMLMSRRNKEKVAKALIGKL